MTAASNFQACLGLYIPTFGIYVMYLCFIHAKHSDSMNPGTKASSFKVAVITKGISEKINLNIPIDGHKGPGADLSAA